MKIMTLLVAASALSTPAIAQTQAPDPARLKASVEKLVSFGTRHTLSSASDPKRGIGAARTWAAAEFARISKTCGGCLKVESVSERFTGPRVPDGADVVDVLAIQTGTGDPNQVVIIAAHIDSRVSDVMDFTSDAPGANDNGSGSALVMEAARVLAGEKFDGTIVYALLSGEEQGLLGGKLLAKTAKARGWQVRAMLNNDIVGNTTGQNGRIVANRVRVFSEGIRSAEDAKAGMTRRGIGGEDDGPSRALAKAIDDIAEANPQIGLDVFAVRRPDRFGRGGDHTPLLEAGYPAVRFSVGIENYDRQHQDLRVEAGRDYGDTVKGMDFPYLAKVTALNVAALRTLASAPAAPAVVSLDGALSMDTRVFWDAVPGAAAYKVYWRRADAQDWADSRVVTGATETVLKDVVVDDHFIGVAAIGKDGAASIVTFGGMAPRK
ncbi:M28 family peptidase [Sphingobium sp. Ant17]|uniref:M28 family peptidase n=1 Tax=Sphingobium sp. Ant17 TaxID=1461752 RepID=UPI000446B640|nr:M28 family peptidase [Sphingobium sp. Ant17]EXS67996.1 peptidase M28 [Sphingobium sp. Ant17]|tara:strand:- start:555 stop:1862 length:1308 start_codon:yes stop_codon:yes gene_type:complete